MGIFDVDYNKMIEYMLTEGEKLELAFSGYCRTGSSTQHVFITNKRVIAKIQHILSSDIIDVLYGDISNVRLHKGIFSSDIYLKPRILSDDMFISYVDNKIAEKATTLIRNHINDFEKQNKKQQIVIQGDSLYSNSNNNNKRICPKCGWQNEREAKFCNDCGFGFKTS